MGRMWNNFFCKISLFVAKSIHISVDLKLCTLWPLSIYIFKGILMIIKLIPKEKYFMTLLGFTEQKLVHLFMDSYGKISNHAGSLEVKLIIADLSSTTQKIRQICNYAGLRF